MEDPDEKISCLAMDKMMAYGNEAEQVLLELSQRNIDKRTLYNIDYARNEIKLYSFLKKISFLKTAEKPDLVFALHLFSDFFEPHTSYNDFMVIFQKYADKLQQNIKKEKTTIGKINAFNDIFFSEMKLQLQPMPNEHAKFLMVNHVLSQKQGSDNGLAFLYLCLARACELPVFAVKTPGSINLGCFQSEAGGNKLLYFANPDAVLCYVNFSGKRIMLTKQEMLMVIKTRYELSWKLSDIEPLTNKEVLCRFLHELRNIYQKNIILIKQYQIEKIISFIHHN